MNIALIKTSSMGDVIHALPVVTDIVHALPGARVDWVVEESLAELPALHPSVREVVPVAVRRWRRSLFSAGTRREIGALRARLRAGRYDLALDLQGLLKSACVARMTGAPVAGFSRRCAREPLAALSYRDRYDVDMARHAIERLRELAGKALGYRPEGPPVFGLSPPQDTVPSLPAEPYALLLHATSRAEKLWPDACWRELIARLAGQGLAAALPWGSAAEHERAVALAGGGSETAASPGLTNGPGVTATAGANPALGAGRTSAPGPGSVDARGPVVLPRLSLRQCAAAIARARLVVGVDTGLTHLAAALDAPTVALFAATPSWRFGPYWTPRATSLGAEGRWPDVEDVLAAAAQVRSAAPASGTSPARSAGPTQAPPLASVSDSTREGSDG